MIVAEELSFREWECFKHLAHKWEGPCISLRRLERPSRESKQREENRTLALPGRARIWNLVLHDIIYDIMI